MPAPLAPLSRGANISRWFRYPVEETERHFRGFITDADLDLIVSLGLTSVRLAVAPAQVLAGGAGESLDPQRLAYLREAVERLTARGLVVILNYHDESRAMETSDAAVESFAAVWTALARHLGTVGPDSLLLEVLNEPVFDARPAAWFPIRRRLVEAVRSAAPRHTIVAGGPHWSSLDGLLMGDPLDDANVVYTFHFYEPYHFTHQGAPWAPNPPRGLSGVPYPASRDQPRTLDQRIASAAAWGARHGVPVWAGEFGAYPPAAPRLDRLRWLHDVRSSCERHGIGWCVWSYDESLGLDRRLDPSGGVVLDWESARALGLRDARAVAG